MLSAWNPLWLKNVRQSLGRRLGTSLAAGALGGVLVGAPARARDVPELRPQLREALVNQLAAVSFQEEDAPELGPQWWKRPTPMRPRDAARHLASAWKGVLGESADTGRVSVLWAQWALETGRGRWMVDYNFAGLKGRAPDGASSLWWTWEESGEDARRVLRRFRAYGTPEAGARDYVEMLVRRYPDAVEAARHGDAAEFVRALTRGGYFSEDPKAYARAVISLAREFQSGELSRALDDV